MVDKNKVENTVDNDALIAQMMQTVEAQPRDNESVKNPVLHKGDADLDAPMIMHVDDPGMVFIWEVSTGRKLKVLRNILPILLKARDDKTGKSRFSVTDPGVVQKVGTLKCPLHPEGDNRGHYDELGLPTCKKSNLTSPYMVEQHCKKRHPSAWATIEQEKKLVKEEEERDFQRGMLRAMEKALKDKK